MSLFTKVAQNASDSRLRNFGLILAPGHVLRLFSRPGPEKVAPQPRFETLSVPGAPVRMYDDGDGSPDGWRKVSATEPRKARRPGTLSDIPADEGQAELPILNGFPRAM